MSDYDLKDLAEQAMKPGVGPGGKTLARHKFEAAITPQDVLDLIRERDAAEAQRDVLRGVLMRLASASKPVADRLYEDGTVPPPEMIRLGETTQFALAVLEEGRSNE